MRRNNYFITQILSLTIKEFLILFRDRKGRLILIMPPLLQLLIFAYAATLEVKNISIAILNYDRGKHSHEIIQRLYSSPTFSKITFLNNQAEIRTTIDNKLSIAVLTIPQNFSQFIERSNDGINKAAKIQVILDGRSSNAAQITNNYINNIINNYNIEVAASLGKTIAITDILTSNWFNKNLLYLWFTVPSLIAALSMLITLIITSLSVARERELGTFDQILVSPLSPYKILIGKTIPAILVGFSEGLLIWLVAVTIFDIPFSGSFLLLVIAMLTFIFSVVGVGLFISAISKTQQQAILAAFIFMVPSITLSGYASPIENMPEWLQLLVEANPLKHFMIISKGLFLKNMPASQVWENTKPLIIIGFITLPLATWYFNKRIGS